MSIVEVTMYQVKCDRCGTLASEGGDYAAWSDAESARYEADEEGWEVINRKDYCPYCLTWSEDETEQIPKPPIREGGE